MSEIKMGQAVKIKQTSGLGKVVAIWQTIAGQTQYSVRYSDQAGGVHDFWFFASDLEIKSE